MKNALRILVRGDFALFTRPEFKTERVTYDVITPSAARGILEAIHWKPAIRWEIDQIQVLKKIKKYNLARNEIKSSVSVRNALDIMNGLREKPLSISIDDERVQRMSICLKDVAYVIYCHFVLTDRAGPDDTDGKHFEIVLRRLRKGQYFQHPYLGTREFPAVVELVEPDAQFESELTGSIDLGFMLRDLDFSQKKVRPEFFHARLENGVMQIPERIEHDSSITV